MLEKPGYKKLYKAIDEILWSDWDPLGMNDIDDVRDEYQSYALQICGLKIHGANQETIAQKLYDFQRDEMSMPGSIENCRQIAEKIINLKG
jgi:hypothetical protein